MKRLRASGPGPVRLLIGSFLGLILIGTVLLMLPGATPAGRPIGLIDALFTATSATCVTGLVVRDTGTAFTPFGQIVILALIQLGGLGIMTFSLLILSLMRGRLSLASRSLLEQTLAGAGHWEDLWPLLRLVFRFAILAEAIGAALLFLAWQDELGASGAAYAAVFHSISAFCNAGFGLWADSLVRYRGDLVVNVTVMGLIVLGGLGFLTVYDLRHARRQGWARISLHSKLALTVSGILIVAGAMVIWLLESGNTLAGLPAGEQVLAALFQSVTPRTAGFNTLDIAALAPATLFLLIGLMFIGGSPGSCAGGIKTTTFGVLVLAAWSRLRNRTNVNAFRRTLPRGAIQNTLSITIAGLFVANAGLFVLLLLESSGRAAQEGPQAFIAYLFETVSALGTVGLSTGVTPFLEPSSRLLVTLLMFLGRLGPLTVAAALARETSAGEWRYPEEDVMVG